MSTTRRSFRTLFKRSPLESEAAQFGRDARADWQFLVIACVVLNFLAVVASGVMYRRVNNEGDLFFVNKKEAAAPRTFDRFQLEKTVALYEAKQARFESLKRAPLPTVDPYVPPLEK